MGFEPADYANEPDTEVWPENWPAFRIFSALSSQWNATTGAVTGLSYPSLYPLLDRAADDADEWDELFADLRVMERAALPLLNKKD